jgi:hypothetical protein
MNKFQKTIFTKLKEVKLEFFKNIFFHPLAGPIFAYTEYMRNDCSFPNIVPMKIFF